MSLFDKLEKAIDKGVVLIDETVVLVRLAQETLRRLEPAIADLPAITDGARRVLERPNVLSPE